MKLTCILAECQNEIPLSRARRGGKTCSPECARELNRLLRSQAAVSHCRLCGRRYRSRSKELKLDPVRSPHNGTQEPLRLEVSVDEE